MSTLDACQFCPFSLAHGISGSGTATCGRQTSEVSFTIIRSASSVNPLYLLFPNRASVSTGDTGGNGSMADGVALGNRRAAGEGVVDLRFGTPDRRWIRGVAIVLSGHVRHVVIRVVPSVLMKSGFCY